MGEFTTLGVKENRLTQEGDADMTSISRKRGGLPGKDEKLLTALVRRREGACHRRSCTTTAFWDGISANVNALTTNRNCGRD
jgi:hypothetical protein